jgi:ribonuclease HI
MVKWSPPPVGVVKANWNVAVDMKNGKLGYGCVIRDSSGNGCVIRDSSGNLQAASCHVEFLMADPMVGKALAALHTVEFCKDKSFSSIVLEGDSLLVVQAINNT